MQLARSHHHTELMNETTARESPIASRWWGDTLKAFYDSASACRSCSSPASKLIFGKIGLAGSDRSRSGSVCRTEADGGCPGRIYESVDSQHALIRRSEIGPARWLALRAVAGHVRHVFTGICGMLSMDFKAGGFRKGIGKGERQ